MEVRKIVFLTVIIIIISVFFSNTVKAQEMRVIIPIPTPAQLPPGAKRIETPKPLDTTEVRKDIEDFTSKWNNGDLAGTISDNFYEKSRLTDSMLTNVPRDAKLKVEGMGGVQTLQQVIMDDPVHGKVKVTTGSVTVKTQIELNDPQQGFVKVPGTNEIIFEMIQKVK